MSSKWNEIYLLVIGEALLFWTAKICTFDNMTVSQTSNYLRQVIVQFSSFNVFLLSPTGTQRLEPIEAWRWSTPRLNR